MAKGTVAKCTSPPPRHATASGGTHPGPMADPRSNHCGHESAVDLSQPAGAPTSPLVPTFAPRHSTGSQQPVQHATTDRTCEDSPSKSGSSADFSLMKGSGDAEACMEAASKDLGMTAIAAAGHHSPDVSPRSAQHSSS